MVSNKELKNELDTFIRNYKKHSGKDNITYKEIIKQKLIDNQNLLYVLNNHDLDIEESPEDYIGTSIYPYYLLPDAQEEVKNYICFETGFTEVKKYNEIMKLEQITFYIMCDVKTAHTDFGIARHDLLAALIDDEFCWGNEFGTKMKLVDDQPRAIDNNYVSRILVFEQITPNSIVSNHKVINQIRQKN